MNQLNKLYRDAPDVESPQALDESVLRLSRSRLPAEVLQARPMFKWATAGYAVSSLCIVGIGLSVVLQSGFLPTGRLQRPAISDAAPEAAESLVAVDQSRAKQLQAAPLVVEEVVQEPMLSADNSTEAPSAESVLDLSGSVSAATIERPGALIESLPESRSVQQTVKQAEVFTASDDRSEGVPSISATASAAAPGSLPQLNSSQAPGDGTLVTTRSQGWLMSQPSQRYSVRIVADDLEPGFGLLADGLGARLPVGTDLVQPTQDATGWLLLHGSFATRQQAMQALAELDLQQRFQKAANGVPVTFEVITFRALQLPGR